MANTGGLLTHSLKPLVLGCPRCGRAFDQLRVDGNHRCGRCGQRFRARIFEPPHDLGPVVLASTQGTPCAVHERNLAVDSCSRCGAFMCELCRIDCDGQQVCPGCFDRLQKEGALPSLRTKITNYHSIALTCAVLGLPGTGLVFGSLAIFFAIRGQRQNARLGERISSTAGVVAVILGAIDLVLSVILVLFLFGVFR